MRRSNYDKFPCVSVPDGANACVSGWDAIGEQLVRAVGRRSASRTVVVVECYPGVHDSEVFRELEQRLKPALALQAKNAMLPPAKVDALVAPFLGGNDPVFGFLCDLQLPQFFDEQRLQQLRRCVDQVTHGVVLVVGCGARLVAEGDILVYADLAR